MMYPIFGYGSLCDLSSLKECDGICRDIKVDVKLAKINGYRICLNQIATCGKFGYANIIETCKKDDCVYGVVIYLTDEELTKIDKREKCYERIKVDVITEDGQLSAETYIAILDCQSENDMPITELYNMRLQTGLKYMKEMGKKGFYDYEYFGNYSEYYDKYTKK